MACANSQKCGQLYVIVKAHVWVPLLQEAEEKNMTNPKCKKVAQHPTVSKESVYSRFSL